MFQLLCYNVARGDHSPAVLSSECRAKLRFPKGPKIEQIQDLAIFKRDQKFKLATHQTPIFCGEF